MCNLNLFMMEIINLYSAWIGGFVFIVFVAIVEISKVAGFWTPWLAFCWRFLVVIFEVISINILHVGIYSPRLEVRCSRTCINE